MSTRSHRDRDAHRLVCPDHELVVDLARVEQGQWLSIDAWRPNFDATIENANVVDFHSSVQDQTIAATALAPIAICFRLASDGSDVQAPWTVAPRTAVVIPATVNFVNDRTLLT